MSSNPPSHSVPPLIPDYELLRMVGRGSYGDVWLARGVTGLYRAVKIVWRERFEDSEPYEREFNGLREFAAISLIEARQLALLHVGRNNAADYFYYVMELADDAESGGEIDPARYQPHTLREAHRRRGRIPTTQVIALGSGLAHALAGLHARGLVHRDVKPSNVIFVGGVPKLADIGLVTASATARTFVGTEGYVPPEGPGTAGADVFGLGKLLYEIATGLDRHEYPRLPPNFADFPDRRELLELNEILMRACDPRSSSRYPDGSALLHDLHLLQSGRSMRRLRAAQRWVARTARVALFLGLAALVAGAGMLYQKRQARADEARHSLAEMERSDRIDRLVYSAGLATAERALDLGEFGKARRELVSLAPAPGARDLRGFEWSALMAEAAGDPANVLRESGPVPGGICFSTDGQWLAVHSADGRVTLWDAATGRTSRTISAVRRIAGFSGDGQWLLGWSADPGLREWAVRPGVPDHEIPSRSNDSSSLPGYEVGMDLRKRDSGIGYDEALAFSPDGRLLAAGGADRIVRVLDAWTGRTVNELRGHDGAIAALAWAPDGLRLVSTSAAGDVRMWTDPSHPNRRAANSLESSSSLRGAIALSKDGRQIAAMQAGQGVGILATETMETVRIVAAAVRPIAFIGQGRTLLTLSEGGHLQSLAPDDTGSSEEFALFEGTAGACLALSADGRWLAVGDVGGRLKIWDRANRIVVDELPAHEDAIRIVAITADGGKVATSTSGSCTRVWPAGKGTPRTEWNSPAPALSSAFSPSGDWLSLGLENGDVEIRRLAPQGFSTTLRTGSARATAVAFSPDGKRLVCGGSSGLVHVFATDDWREITTLSATDNKQEGDTSVEALAFSADSLVLGSCLANGHIRIWRQW